MLTTEQLQQIADDPKEYLSRNYRIEMRIKAKRDRIEHLHNICNSTTQEIKPVVVYTGPSKKLENCICEAIDLETEIRQEIVVLEQIQRETAEAIRLLMTNENHKVLLELRYLTGKRWEEIAVDMDFTYRWTMTLHQQALAEMRKNAKTFGESALIHI